MNSTSQIDKELSTPLSTHEAVQSHDSSQPSLEQPENPSTSTKPIYTLDQRTPPSHKSEKIFRRYEKVIGLFLESYPSEFLFDPYPFSPTTAVSRFRDSISSVLEYNWTTPLDLKRLDSLKGKYNVTYDEKRKLVSVAPPNKHSSKNDFKVFTSEASEPLRITDTSPNIPYAFCVLLDKRLLPFHVELQYVLSDEVQTKIKSQWDVSIDIVNGKTILT